jgi:hypothetical protein
MQQDYGNSVRYRDTAKVFMSVLSVVVSWSKLRNFVDFPLG